MRVTAKQANVLDNLHRITFRLVGGRRKPFLDGEPCYQQVNSLATGGLITWNRTDKPVRIGDPEGPISRHVGGHRWRMPTAMSQRGKP